METKKPTSTTGFKLSVMTLAIMNVTAVVSLRGLAAEAEYGLSSAFYYLFAANMVRDERFCHCFPYVTNHRAASSRSLTASVSRLIVSN